MLRSAIALGTMLLAAAPASAQFYGGFSERSSITIRGPGFRFSAYSRSFYSAPMYGYAWVPAFGPGYGPGFGNPFFLPPPPIVAGPTFVIPIGNNEPVHPEADVIKGDFRVIMPRKKEEGFVAPMFERIVVPEKPVVRPNPFAVPQVVGLTEPALGADEQLKLARDALVVREYGTAVERLDCVLAVKPDDATTLFLKSQAQFAAGQYSESVATIRAGIKFHPKWPSLEVKPLELFGKPARFDGLLGDLKRSLDANPDSTALQFLFAHQLWFNGDRENAKAIFERLAARLKDGEVTGPFLK